VSSRAQTAKALARVAGRGGMGAEQAVTPTARYRAWVVARTRGVLSDVVTKGIGRLVCTGHQKGDVIVACQNGTKRSSKSAGAILDFAWAENACGGGTVHGGRRVARRHRRSYGLARHCRQKRYAAQAEKLLAEAGSGKSRNGGASARGGGGQRCWATEVGVNN